MVKSLYTKLVRTSRDTVINIHRVWRGGPGGWGGPRGDGTLRNASPRDDTSRARCTEHPWRWMEIEREIYIYKLNFYFLYIYMHFKEHPEKGEARLQQGRGAAVQANRPSLQVLTILVPCHMGIATV